MFCHVGPCKKFMGSATREGVKVHLTKKKEKEKRGQSAVEEPTRIASESSNQTGSLRGQTEAAEAYGSNLRTTIHPFGNFSCYKHSNNLAENCEKKAMGLPSEMRDAWINARKSLLIASPSEEQRILNTKRCTQEGVIAGAQAASVACVASAVPTLIAVRVFPWAKSNLNYTAQALIISAASIAAYFITADKTILECARRNAKYDRRA